VGRGGEVYDAERNVYLPTTEIQWTGGGETTQNKGMRRELEREREPLRKVRGGNTSTGGARGEGPGGTTNMGNGVRGVGRKRRGWNKGGGRYLLERHGGG